MFAGTVLVTHWPSVDSQEGLAIALRHVIAAVGSNTLDIGFNSGDLWG